MRIRVTVPNSDIFPSQYRGTDTEVEVAQIKFPDGTQWIVEGESYAGLKSAGASYGNASSVIDALGAKPTRMEINF